MPDDFPKNGDKYVVVTAFKALVSVQYFAPGSDAQERLLPEGLHFAIWGNPSPAARAAAARPVELKRWEDSLVSKQVRNDKLYPNFLNSMEKASKINRSLSKVSTTELGLGGERTSART